MYSLQILCPEYYFRINSNIFFFLKYIKYVNIKVKLLIVNE